MKKKPIMVLLLVIVTVFYALFAIWSLIQYKYDVSRFWRECDPRYHPYVHEPLYRSFWYAKAVGLIGVAVFVSWILVALMDYEVKT